MAAHPPDRPNGRDDAASLTEYRFREIERRLTALEDHLREQLAVGARVDGALTDIIELRQLVRDVEQGMTAVIRSGRADTLKYVAFTVGPAALAATAVVVALLTGVAEVPK